MFTSIGKLKYQKAAQYQYKLILEADQGISDFYRALIPRYLHIQQQMYRAHISVVRWENPIKLEFWGKHQNELITFQYDSYVYNDQTYYWLNVSCPRLEQIRMELGLSPSRFVDENMKLFHLTIGNIKKGQ